MFIKNSSKKGFTLVEVVVTMGIASILSLGLMQMMSRNAVMSKRMELKSNWNNLINFVRYAYSDINTCTATFNTGRSSVTPAMTPATYSFGPHSSITLTQLDLIRDNLSTPTKTYSNAGPLLKNGAAINGMLGVDIKLVANFNADLGVQNVIIDGVQKSLNAYGAHLEIKAARIAGPMPTGTPAPDLYSGLTTNNIANDPTSTINLIVYSNTHQADGSDVIQYCKGLVAADTGCPEGEDYTAAPSADPHAPHGHPHCNRNLLILNPMNNPSVKQTGIYFGDNYADYGAIDSGNPSITVGTFTDATIYLSSPGNPGFAVDGVSQFNNDVFINGVTTFSKIIKMNNADISEEVQILSGGDIQVQGGGYVNIGNASAGTGNIPYQCRIATSSASGSSSCTDVTCLAGGQNDTSKLIATGGGVDCTGGSISGSHPVSSPTGSSGWGGSCSGGTSSCKTYAICCQY